MEALRTYLKDRAITQAEFASQLGVSQPTVSEWINGESFPTVTRLAEISRRTGISVDKLISEAADS
jgi:transcriptional regulator with XRE-family HTH domain